MAERIPAYHDQTLREELKAVLANHERTFREKEETQKKALEAMKAE